MKIVTVVVTYNRKEMLRKNLEALLAQTQKTEIYIIDNHSTDGTYEYIKDLLNEYITYERLKENTGGAGGFSYGIKKAFENGADVIWGMDDDAIPEKEALEKLITVYKQKGDSVCLWSNCNQDIWEGNEKEVDHWMFVGFLVTRKVIEKIGYPRADYFIYLDDWEYSRRIIKNGFKILKIKDSVIDHKDAIQNKYPVKKIFGIKLEWTELPDWKFYYWVRNYILTFQWTELGKYITITLKMAKIFLFTLIYNKKQLKWFWRGYFDGIFGRTGKRVNP